MRGLRAALWKDVRLFRSGAGLLALILPLVLLVALRAGGGDLAKGAYVEPFPIALRDEDRTVMSRSLAGQIARVELFSQVLVAAEGETNRMLLDRGAAAVVTIPKDFFYTLYTMNNAPVQIVLNEAMPLESSIFRSVIVSVMGIIGADQTAGRAVYRYCYGELTPEREKQLWAETSAQLIRDALGRQRVFETAVEGSGARAALELNFFACCLSVLCLFFPLTAVKTLPEELAMGVLPRYLAAGGELGAFFLSKFLTAALLALPALLLMTVLFQPMGWPCALLTAAILFFGAFGLFLFVAAWAGGSAATQRWGNLILLLSLTAGGALYPWELLPAPAQLIGPLTLPYYARLGLETAQQGQGAGALMGRLWPVLVMGASFAALSVPGFQSVRRSRGSKPAGLIGVGEEPATQSGSRRLGPLWVLALIKVRAMSGGRAGLFCLVGAILLCGVLSASALRSAGPDRLAVAVAVEDEGPYGAELAGRLAEQKGIALITTDRETGKILLSSGDTEGLLLVGAGYSAALKEGRDLPLSYESAASAASAQAAREIAAGQVAAQQARLRGARDAGARLGRALTSAERSTLFALMDEEEAAMAPLYQLSGSKGGAPGTAPFAPSPMGFAALAVMLTLFTLASWTGGVDARRVERRMSVMPHGQRLSYLSDCLALLLVGLLTGLAALLPGGIPGLWSLWALSIYVFCITGLALALTRLSALSGRMDALAPFVALITCLVGGCFGDLAQFSPFLQMASLCTPQGLALRGAAGNPLCLAVLAGMGAVLHLLGRPPRESGRSD